MGVTFDTFEDELKYIAKSWDAELRVFLLMHDYDYEGNTIVKIYFDEERAKKNMKLIQKENPADTYFIDEEVVEI